MSKVAISIRDLAKRYELKSQTGLRDFLKLSFKKKKTKELWALEDINLDIERGETVGLIGSNGAGKSTLLKILSSVTWPTKGMVELDGQVTSMLEVGTGFHHDLTGRENIYFNASLLGLSNEAIEELLPLIIRFSELDEFIDLPVKNYSSGMFLKLAFSVAVHTNAEIIIIDEVLSVGDPLFQQKCLEKIMELSQNKTKTIVVVSHNTGLLREICTRGIYMKNGNVAFDGGINAAINTYYADQNKRTNLKLEGQYSNSYKITDFRINELTESDSPIDASNETIISFNLHGDKSGELFLLFKFGNISLFTLSSTFSLNLEKPSTTMEFRVKPGFFSNGVYTLALFSQVDTIDRAFYIENIKDLCVIDDKQKSSYNALINYS